ncbi:MAG: 16S rRNA (cytosine(967)-C(5))-methyltransferase, partial [Defluviitaleaceae bacterium]|nr:16S rRNA (cytosine(967)-C(5))-methyltransferase [Defluviitaleaceae bacterium]
MNNKKFNAKRAPKIENHSQKPSPCRENSFSDAKKNSDRAVALTVLAEVLESGAYTNIALRKIFSGSAISPQSRAFITELVNETIRNLILIDHTIESFSNANELKPLIKNILRISVCQIRFIERIPDRAAVNEAVDLTKMYGFERLAGFVNGILR